MTESNITIPEEELQKVRTEFDHHPTVIALRRKQAEYRRTGQYIQAIAMGRAISKLYDETLANLQKEEQQKVERVDLAKAQLPPDARKTIMTLIITIFMACDIIESSVLDFNETLHKSLGDDYNLDMFNPLQDALKKAQQSLTYLNANSPYMKRAVWGDKCDNMYTMMRHKAESIIMDFLRNSKQIKK